MNKLMIAALAATMLTVEEEKHGKNCPWGGVKITDATGNETYVCNGAFWFIEQH